MGKSHDPLPTMPAGLTPQWLDTALHSCNRLEPQTQVTSVTLHPVGEGVGMMSELSRVALTYSSRKTKAPATLIAKYASQNETNRSVAVSYNIYEREVRYFKELDQRTTARTPSIYLCHIDGDHFLILMEDLADYRCGNQIEGATLSETQLAIDELAKLHGTFWNAVDELDWVPGIADSYHADNMFALQQTGWPVMAAAFAECLPPSIVGMGETFTTSLRALQERVHAAPLTLLHGDFRMENLMFGTRSEHDPIAILDWQGPLLGRGIVDVAMMLGQSTQTAVRREHEDELLARYVNGLSNLGVEYSLDEARQDYLVALLYNWCYVAVVSGTLDSSNQRAFDWMSEMIRRQVAITEDHDLFSLLD